MVTLKPLLHVVAGVALGAGMMGMLQPTLARSIFAPEVPISTARFTYQGRLNKGGAPFTGSCSVSFKLFDAASGGAQIGSTNNLPALAVDKGLFTVELDFGWTAFNTQARWLETAVGCGEAQVTLTPRTAINPAPYALALPGMRTVPGAAATFNVIGGSTSNGISDTIASGVIGGGATNRIAAPSGLGIAAADDATIAGGRSNLIGNTGYRSVIGGGEGNVITNAHHAVVAGGSANQNLGGYYGSVGGGRGNIVENLSDFATVPGGYQATANSFGQFAYASGMFNIGSRTGMAQTGMYVLRGTSTGALTSTLYLNGTSAEIEVPTGSAMAFQVQAVGFINTQTTAAEVRASGWARCTGTAPSLDLTASWNYPGDINPKPANWNIQIDEVGGAACKLRVAAKGNSGETIRWVATVRTTEVSW
jgi:hypothetical protein